MSGCRATPRDTEECRPGGLKHIRPHCPWTNGKVERRKRTLAGEWAYSRPWSSNAERTAASPDWLEHDNLERPHLGIGGLRPTDRVNNAAGQQD